MTELSQREKEILSLVCLTNGQIAKRLNLSWRTVQRVFSTMFERYGVKTRTRLLIEAVKSGEIRTIDCGYWNDYGQYVEDIRTIDLRKEKGENNGINRKLFEENRL